MMSSASGLPVFGVAPSGIDCHPRSAAYAVIPDLQGRVAAVREGTRYWLPGGGMHPGETPEQTVTREVREELGRAVRLLGRIGQAVQYFYAGDEQRWYEMTAIFFRAEFDGEPLGPREYDLCWLEAHGQGTLFFHGCHAWAASQVGSR